MVVELARSAGVRAGSSSKELAALLEVVPGAPPPQHGDHSAAPWCWR